MTYFDAILLGITQGITEMLPISSTAHVNFVQKILSITNDNVFSILLNLGTIFAISLFYFKEIFKIFLGLMYSICNFIENFMQNSTQNSSKNETQNQLSKTQNTTFTTQNQPPPPPKQNEKNTQNQSQVAYNLKSLDIHITQPDLAFYARYAFLIIFATLPCLFFGVIYKNFIEPSIIYAKYLTIFNMILFAIILYFADKKGETNFKKEQIITPKIYLLLGFAQMLAVFPGISRLGICLIVCRNFNISRLISFQISMILSLPSTFAACIYSIFTTNFNQNYLQFFQQSISKTQFLSAKFIYFGNLTIGIICSFIFGFFMLKIINKLLTKHSLLIVVIYRIIFAIILCIFY